MNCTKLLKLFEACLAVKYRHCEEGASFYVRRENNRVTVFFEKSNGATDWRNNLRFSARPYRDMKEPWYCHRGFLAVFRAVLAHLETIFLDESVKEFQIVGYSHGAALALLSHEYILFHRPELLGRVESVGFGCPRVIYGRITPSLRARLFGFYIVKNHGDIVTHLPPRLFGYCHPVKPVVIGMRGKYSPIDAHRPESYLAELSAAARREAAETTLVKEGVYDTGGNGGRACEK